MDKKYRSDDRLARPFQCNNTVFILHLIAFAFYFLSCQAQVPDINCARERVVSDQEDIDLSNNGKRPRLLRPAVEHLSKDAHCGLQTSSIVASAGVPS